MTSTVNRRRHHLDQRPSRTFSVLSALFGITSLAMVVGMLFAVSASAADFGGARDGDRTYLGDTPRTERVTCYVGGHVGAAWGDGSAKVGVPVPPGTTVSGFDADAIQVGVGVGCDLYVPNSRFVVGILGDYTNGGLTQGVNITAGPTSLTGEYDIEHQWFVGGRLGYRFTPSVMVYGLAGHTWGQTTGMDITLNNVSLGTIAQSDLRGWTFGGGTEVRFTDGWRGKLEYRYTDFQSTANLGGLLSTSSVDHSVRIGLSYHFGGL